MKKFLTIIILLAGAIQGYSQSGIAIRPAVTLFPEITVTDTLFIGDDGSAYVTRSGDTIAIYPGVTTDYVWAEDGTFTGTLTVDNLVANNLQLSGLALDSVYLSYGAYQKYRDQFGNLQNVFRLNPDNSIGLGTNLGISGFYTLPNHRGSWFDIGIDSDADYGDVVGISGYMGGIRMVDYRLEADGAGGIVDGSAYVIHYAQFVEAEHPQETDAVTGDTEFTAVIPAGYMLVAIVLEETAGNTATLDLGTTAGGFEVFSSESVTASDITTFQLFKYFSDNSSTTLYLNDDQAGSSWNSASVDVKFWITKMTE